MLSKVNSKMFQRASSIFKLRHSISLIICIQYFCVIECYRATVFEFSPYFAANPIETLLENTKDYVQRINNSYSQDILVFPEYGLTTYQIFNKDNFKEYAITIPKINNGSLCGNLNVHKILQDISCSTMAKKTYSVINLLESADDKFFNTNIVFDRTGTIIARYRKINLFAQENMSLEAGKKLVTFKTDFNVTFGIFTCFDILFQYPAIEILKNEEVNDIVFPTAWFSQLPYLHALSVQDGYQATTRVNFLASNYNYPQNRGGGSGIYTKNTVNTIISSTRETKQISNEVSKTSRDKHVCFERKPHGNTPKNKNISLYRTSNDIEENVDHYNFALLLPNITEHNEILCHLGTCCVFNATIEKPLTEHDPTYKFSVYNYENSVACALVACTGNESKSCGNRSEIVKNVNFLNLSVQSINLKAAHYTIPTTLNYELEPLVYTYCDTHHQITIQSHNKLNGLITFGFYSMSSANILTVNPWITICSFFIFISSYKYSFS